MQKFNMTLMEIAEKWSDMSSANRVKVGCVISKDTRVVSSGYNGTLPGESNVCENEDGHTKPTVVHAEFNAIMSALTNKIDLSNAVLFNTLSPCIECGKLIKASGIKEVFYRDEYRDLSGIEFLKSVGVKVTQIRTDRSGESDIQMALYQKILVKRNANS